MNDQKKILIIDDDKDIIRGIRVLLKDDYCVYGALSGEEGLRKVRALIPDLIVLDLKMPHVGGMEVLRSLNKENLGGSVMMMTGYGDIQSAVETMKLGAVDYITKPFDNKKLKNGIDMFFSLRADSPSSFKYEIVGQSPELQKVWHLLTKFAPSDITVLIQGESGTGKELFAKAIHRMSKRRDNPLMPIDCSSVPESLLESELFGHERGAFTHAYERKPGKFQLANEGTIFLDEIGNLPLQAQTRLLRVLQEQIVYPLGAKKPIHLDLRILAATNIDLRQAVEQGIFRRDLYYRLSAVTISLPALRDRSGDIELLANHFLKRYNQRFNKEIYGISDNVSSIFNTYEWPGNIRELGNVIKSAVILANQTIEPSHLPQYLQKLHGSDLQDDYMGLRLDENSLIEDIKRGVGLKSVANRIAEQAEKRIISALLQEGELNKNEIANLLHIDPKTLRSKLKKLNLGDKR